jgi:hypothetical protein
MVVTPALAAEEDTDAHALSQMAGQEHTALADLGDFNDVIP